MASLGRGDSLTPVHGSTWRGPAVLLSMTRADPAVPPTPLKPASCPQGMDLLGFLLEQESLGGTQSHWYPGLTTHSSPEDRNGHKAPPVGETIWPSLPGAKRAWVVSGTQDFGLKPGGSQANLDELVTLLSSMWERPGRGGQERAEIFVLAERRWQGLGTLLEVPSYITTGRWL